MADDATPPPDRPSPRLVALLVALVLGLALMGYRWTSHPRAGPGAVMEAPSSAAVSAPAPSPNPEPQAGPSPNPEQQAQAALIALTEQLAARLASQPQDGEGWAMLGRSQLALGRTADAIQAFDRALVLRPRDADLLADQADALGMAQGFRLEGAPMRRVQQALAIDPAHIKALTLAGTHALQQHDEAGAVRFWERAVRAAAPDDERRPQLLQALAGVRARVASRPAAP
ncbi:MAG: tetratricopeptide repeat protein [Rhodoferax sp.]|nr:tetratricopeptide repeat protein [Rhodoferax sp.]